MIMKISHVQISHYIGKARVQVYLMYMVTSCKIFVEKKNNIHIMNGRAGKDGLIVERTCEDLTVIDYCLCSSKLLSHFQILR